MTDREQELTDLLEKVQSDTAWSFTEWGHLEPKFFDLGISAYNGSLDAARALHDAMLPGFHPVIDAVVGEVTLYEHVGDDEWEHRHEAQNQVPAREWLIAILKALIIQEKDDDL